MEETKPIENEEVQEKDLVAQAKEVAEDLKKTLAEIKEVEARAILGGRADATPNVEATKEEMSDAEYAQRALENDLPKEE